MSTHDHRPEPAPERLWRLGSGLALLVWDEDHRSTQLTSAAGDTAPVCSVRLSDGPRATAYSATSVVHSGGRGAGLRHALLMHFPTAAMDEASALLVTIGDERRVVALDRDLAGDAVASASAALVEDVDAGGRHRLLCWLLRACVGPATPTAEAARLAHALAVTDAADVQDLACVVTLDAGHVLVQARLPVGLGPVRFLATLGGSGIRISRIPAAPGARAWLAAETRLLRGARCCIIACRDAVVVRNLTAGRIAHVDLLTWLRTHADERGEQLHGILAAMAPVARSNPRVRTLGTELQLRFPLRQRAALSEHGPLAAELCLAVCDDDGGIFVSGWLHDPHALLERAAVRALHDTREEVDLRAGGFPSRLARQRCEKLGRHTRDADLGFVAYVAGARAPWPSLQPELELILRSGTRMRLTPVARKLDAAQAKAAVLASVPTEFLDPDLMQRCVAPAVSRLHARHLAGERIRRVHDIGVGPARPGVTAVIPVYRKIEYLKTQLACLAIDPSLADLEVVIVLDSPELARAVAHLLQGLCASYAMALRLVVMSENFGFAAACNAGASLARAETLLMLNSDVLPPSQGWLTPLREVLRCHPGVAAVGPRLLFDDGSLQHAGMYFARDGQGRWLNRHYHKGYPGDHGPACVAREVPALTGACLALRAGAFHEVGGFTEDYVYGDYEDSDLCLKLRRAGHGVRYEPRAVLHHLERRSFSLHPGYSQGAAWLYNCSLHQQRWQQDIQDIMERLHGDGLPAGDERLQAPRRPLTAGVSPAAFSVSEPVDAA